MSAFFTELFQTRLYKRTQGRMTRQVTFAAMVVSLCCGAYALYATLMVANQGTSVRYGVSLGLIALGIWVAYRVVNFPAVADFLIAVEAEMNKVSWPTRTELFRSSMVVLVTIFVLAALLFSFDLLWSFFFRQVLGI